MKYEEQRAVLKIIEKWKKIKEREVQKKKPSGAKAETEQYPKVKQGGSAAGDDAETVTDWRDSSPGEKPRTNIPTLNH